MMVAGHPVPPESAAALAEHDRMPRKSDGCREVYVHRAEVRVAAAEYVRTAGGVIDLDTLTETMTGDGHPLAGEVPRAVQAQCPMSLEPDTDPDVDRVRPVGPSFCGWYDHQGTVYVATTIRALRSVVQAEEEAERRRERARKKRERRRAREAEQDAEDSAPVQEVPNRTAEQWHTIVAAAGDMIDSGATLTGAARRLGVSRRSLADHMRAEGVTDGLPSTPAPRHPMGVAKC